MKDLERFVDEMKKLRMRLLGGISPEKSLFVPNGVKFGDTDEEADLIEKSRKVRLGQPIDMPRDNDNEIDQVIDRVIDDIFDEAS
jgi:hypothetical protein